MVVVELEWEFGLCDLAGVAIGPIYEAHDRRLSIPLNGLPTASLRLRLDDPMADEITSRDADCLLKVYQGTTLRFIGDVTDTDEVLGEDAASLAVNAAGPFWRLSKRLVGLPYPSALRTWTAPANEIVDSWINQTNTNSDSGIRLGTRDVLASASVGTDEEIAFKPVSEAITELRASTGTFDFRVNPVEPTADASGYPGTLPYIGTLDVLTQIGTASTAVFEVGAGVATMKGYKRLVDRKGLMNIGYVLPPSFEVGVTPVGDIAAASDATSIAARGQYEEVIPADLQDPAFRQALVDAHVLVRKVPRQQITFEPSASGGWPEFGTDYSVGDTVTARATYNSQERFNGTFRVYGVEITVDGEGRANVVPTVVPD